jgi:hypothetical protein
VHAPRRLLIQHLLVGDDCKLHMPAHMLGGCMCCKTVHVLRWFALLSLRATKVQDRRSELQDPTNAKYCVYSWAFDVKRCQNGICTVPRQSPVVHPTTLMCAMPYLGSLGAPTGSPWS